MALTVNSPLDVLWGAEMLGHRLCERGKAECCRAVDSALGCRAAGCLARLDPPLVGRRLAGDQALAESLHRTDEDSVARARDGVGAQGDSRHLRVDHLLDDDRDRRGRTADALCFSVGGDSPRRG